MNPELTVRKSLVKECLSVVVVVLQLCTHQSQGGQRDANRLEGGNDVHCLLECEKERVTNIMCS